MAQAGLHVIYDSASSDPPCEAELEYVLQFPGLRKANGLCR